MKRIKLEHEKLPGLRIIKTVFALFIVLLISVATNGFLPPYDLAVVAVLAMQEAVVQNLYPESEAKILCCTESIS